MRSHASRRSTESALGNPVLVQFTIACFLATIAQCSFFVGALVYAYDRGAHTSQAWRRWCCCCRPRSLHPLRAPRPNAGTPTTCTSGRSPRRR